MYPFTNTHSGHTTSTESTKSYPSKLRHVKQNGFPTTIKYLLANFYDKFKESLKETIADQYEHFDEKFEKNLQTLSLHTKEDSTKFSLKLDDRDNKISSFTASYNELLDNLSANNKSRTNIEILKTEPGATMNMRLNKFKHETVSSIDTKLSALSSNKPSSYTGQPLADLIKWPLIKSPKKYSHSSKFTKYISSMTLEGSTLL